jgi:hypothetical protein
LLDEFAAYGNIPGIDVLQATIRNRGIGIVLGFQDQQQLQKVYSTHEAEVLFTNTDTKVLFATSSAKAQQQISQMLGKATKAKKQISSTGHISRPTFGAPLMEPGEIGSKIKEGQVLLIRNARNPLIVDTCDTGKYNAYEHTYPAPQKPKKEIDPKIFDDVKEAEIIEYDEDKAQQQISKYEQLWKAKMDAEEKLALAKQQNIAGPKIKTLELQLAEALAAYDKFVAPEPDPVTKDESVEKEVVAKTPTKPTQPKPTEPTPAMITPVTATPKKNDEPPPAMEESEEEADDPFKGQYADDDVDHFEKYYAEDKK